MKEFIFGKYTQWRHIAFGGFVFATSMGKANLKVAIVDVAYYD